MASDPWGVLGVPSTASPEQARRAYAVKARLLHPDKHQDSGPDVLAEAQRAMTELNEAWATVRDLLSGPSPATDDPAAEEAGRLEELRVLLQRDLDSATTALDLVRATRQLRVAAVRALLARYERSRWVQLNTQLEEMLGHAEARAAAARRAVTDAERRRDRFGSRRRLLRHHRLALQAHEVAVRCHRRLLLGEPLDDDLTRLETLVADLARVPDA